MLFYLCICLNMTNLKMYSYRITKYNPKNRNDLGWYLANEWTSISDIGQFHNGKRVSKKEYFEIENSYVVSIRTVINFLRLKSLYVSNLEKHSTRPRCKRYTSKSMQELYKSVTDGMELCKQQIADMARLVLRELIWCKLETKDMSAHFGYDYYMYIITFKELSSSLKDKIYNMGLFVEDFESPYLPENE